MSWFNGLVEPNASESVCDVNNIINQAVARDIPTLVIDQNIGWLTRMRCDIDYTINRLEQVKKQRSRSQKWRDSLNNVAREFCDTENIDMDMRTRMLIIQQRLGCDPDRARAIATLVHAWAKRKRRKNRNDEISALRDAGVSVTELSRRYDLTRAQIYTIIADARRHRYLV